MMKKLLSLGLILFLQGCATTTKKFNMSVNSRIINIYSSSVSIANKDGRVFGSGTIIKNHVGEKMLVLTAAHVVVGMHKRKMTLNASFSYQDENIILVVVKMNLDKDLALLSSNVAMKFSGASVKVSARRPKIDDQVWVIGAPFGAERTVVRGTISNYRVMGKKFTYRTTAPIIFGNSGGGMFNVNGELVGVMHAMTMMFGIIPIPGAGYAISLHDIRHFL